MCVCVHLIEVLGNVHCFTHTLLLVFIQGPNFDWKQIEGHYGIYSVSMFYTRFCIHVHYLFLITRLNSQLEELERKHGISQRWSQSDESYKECLLTLTAGRLEIVLVSLLKHRQKREFLLNLKKKYAGMGGLHYSKISC